MRKILLNLILVLYTASCSNSSEYETGEIKTLQLLKKAFEESSEKKSFVDASRLLSRKQVDLAKTPVLFVKLASGQNGTLTPYPDQGIGQTWLGADGATITLNQGVLLASRGMGDDMMGSLSSMPDWSKININPVRYSRKISYLNGNNKISSRTLKCEIRKTNQKEAADIWDVKFRVTKFEENCDHKGFKIGNTYYLDDQGIVRKSFQFHGDTLGYIYTERLDR